MLYLLVFRAIVGLLKPSKRSEPDSEGFLVQEGIYISYVQLWASM